MISYEYLLNKLPDLLTCSDEIRIPELREFCRERIIHDSDRNLRFYRGEDPGQPDTFDRLITDYWAGALFTQKEKMHKQDVIRLVNDVVDLSILSRSSYPIHNLDYSLAILSRNNHIGRELSDIVKKKSMNADPWVATALMELSRDLEVL